ncbi:hypothetical protein BTJ40_06785 [Microbulbifer sp. A4B17]|nr:hypothetical protein BTJ40_06785 [Microbulbifer sp. A4B17]
MRKQLNILNTMVINNTYYDEKMTLIFDKGPLSLFMQSLGSFLVYMVDKFPADTSFLNLKDDLFPITHWQLMPISDGDFYNIFSSIGNFGSVSVTKYSCLDIRLEAITRLELEIRNVLLLILHNSRSFGRFVVTKYRKVVPTGTGSVRISRSFLYY